MCTCPCCAPRSIVSISEVHHRIGTCWNLPQRDSPSGIPPVQAWSPLPTDQHCTDVEAIAHMQLWERWESMAIFMSVIAGVLQSFPESIDQPIYISAYNNARAVFTFFFGTLSKDKSPVQIRHSMSIAFQEMFCWSSLWTHKSTVMLVTSQDQKSWQSMKKWRPT